MARLDARVAAELPAKAEFRLKSRMVSSPVLLKDLSLGGALVLGLKPISGQVTLRATLPGGEVALAGSALRHGRNGTAVRFHTPDLAVFTALWDHIRNRLSTTGECPYCRRESPRAGSNCPGCKGYLEFRDPGYLEAHLKNTLAERIRSRCASLDLPKLQKILRLLEEESSGEPAVVPDTEANASQALALLVRNMAPEHGNILISRLLDLLNAAALHPPTAESPEDRLWWADHFLRSYVPAAGKNFLVFSGEAREWIRQGEWKGGFAALEERVREGIARARGEEVTLEDLLAGENSPVEQGETYRDLMARSGKDAVRTVLERNGFNIARSARELKISRPGLYWLMKRYEIRKPE